MTRLTRTLRFGAVALLLLGAAGAGLAQHVDAAGTAKLVQSAEQGDAEAQFQLGVMHGCGFGGFEQDSAEALTWYRRSAEQGFAAAQSALGTAYAYGELVEKDYAEAARWCRLAAEQGDSDGQFCLALLYANGAGVEQDDAESVKWLRLAGERRDGMAQARLGDLYAAGEGGVRRDPVEADKWYRLATRTDVEVTMMAGQEFTSGREVLFHLLVLGKMYRDGFGLPRDDVAAYKWLDIAERWRPNSWWTTEIPDGEVRLTEQIRRLGEGMTAEQVAEARLAADTFLETYRDPSAGDDALPPRPDLGWDVPAGTTRAS